MPRTHFVNLRFVVDDPDDTREALETAQRVRDSFATAFAVGSRMVVECWSVEVATHEPENIQHHAPGLNTPTAGLAIVPGPAAQRIEWQYGRNRVIREITGRDNPTADDIGSVVDTR